MASVGAAAGTGTAAGVGGSIARAVGTASGSAAASGAGFGAAPSVGVSAGTAHAHGVGHFAAPDPLNAAMSWSVSIDGTLLEACEYDPTTRNLKVIWNSGQFIIVPNMPIGVTNTIRRARDPQAYALGLAATARS
jgi:hypothetical protein